MTSNRKEFDEKKEWDFFCSGLVEMGQCPILYEIEVENDTPNNSSWVNETRCFTQHLYIHIIISLPDQSR